MKSVAVLQASIHGVFALSGLKKDVDEGLEAGSLFLDNTIVETSFHSNSVEVFDGEGVRHISQQQVLSNNPRKVGDVSIQSSSLVQGGTSLLQAPENNTPKENNTVPNVGGSWFRIHGINAQPVSGKPGGKKFLEYACRGRQNLTIDKPRYDCRCDGNSTRKASCLEHPACASFNNVSDCIDPTSSDNDKKGKGDIKENSDAGIESLDTVLDAKVSEGTGLESSTNTKHDVTALIQSIKEQSALPATDLMYVSSVTPTRSSSQNNAFQKVKAHNQVPVVIPDIKSSRVPSAIGDSKSRATRRKDGRVGSNSRSADLMYMPSMTPARSGKNRASTLDVEKEDAQTLAGKAFTFRGFVGQLSRFVMAVGFLIGEMLFIFALLACLELTLTWFKPQWFPRPSALAQHNRRSTDRQYAAYLSRPSVNDRVDAHNREHVERLTATERFEKIQGRKVVDTPAQAA